MTPPNATTTTNVEYEIRALRPIVNIPVINNEESEEESSVNVNMVEEVPPEGEPLGEQPEETSHAEGTDDDTEEYEEVTDSSAASLTTPATSPTAPHMEHHNSPPSSPVTRTIPSSAFHMGEPSRGTIRPRQDDLYTNVTSRQRVHNPERVPHYTTPAMYSPSGDPYRLPTPPAVPTPNPDFTLQIYRQLQTIQNQQRDMQERQEYLESMAVIDSERTRLRLDGFEIELMRLRSTVRSLSARLTRLEDANYGRRM